MTISLFFSSLYSLVNFISFDFQKQINKHGVHQCVDVSRESHSNWMRYVNFAFSTQQQNLIACQIGMDIYFYTIKTVPPNTELLVWFSEDYGERIHRSMCTSRTQTAMALPGKNIKATVTNGIFLKLNIFQTPRPKKKTWLWPSMSLQKIISGNVFLEKNTVERYL